MRKLVLLLWIVAVPAWAQTPAPPKPLPNKAAATCPDCGVVSTVRSIKKELPAPESTESKPSGLVATIPLGGGKAKVGSSTRYGADAVPTSERWEVAVRLENDARALPDAVVGLVIAVSVQEVERNPCSDSVPPFREGIDQHAASHILVAW